MGEESGKMASWVIYFTFFIFSGKHCVNASLPTYTIHHETVNFEKATVLCSPGVLTTLATTEEVTKILQSIISEKRLPQGKVTFWIGLKKAKDTCVVSSLPLRGFHWTEDDSKDSEVSTWAKEPTHTCTAAYCATLQVQLDGTAAPKWGLVAVTCQNTSVYPFICKLRERDNSKPDPPNPGPVHLPHEPDSSKYKPDQPQPHNPNEPGSDHPDQPKPTAPGQRKLDPAEIEPDPTKHHGSEAPKPEPVTPESPKYNTLEPEHPTGQPEVTTDMELNPKINLGPSSEPNSGFSLGVWSNDCQTPIIPGSRSLSPDHSNGSRILVECWSTVKVELRCQGRPATWHLLTGSAANFTSLCRPCDTGFLKDISGVCQDVDECSGTPCKHTCVNTMGSYSCVCYDEKQNHHEEGSTECVDTLKVEGGGALSGIWIPVLIAVAALVVLVVIILVIVKCFLMSKKKGNKGDGQ